MYCKYCGKEIDKDSKFCAECGKAIEDNSKDGFIFFNRFTSLSKKWQICIMIYFIWLMIGGIILITNAPYTYAESYAQRTYYSFDYETPLLVLIIFVFTPILALFTWYYFKFLHTKNVKKDKTKRPKLKIRPKMYSFTLTDFVRIHGKMQVKTVINTNTNETHSYCVFINEQGIETIVEFSKELGMLTARDIANKKDDLVVIQKIDGSFVLK